MNKQRTKHISNSVIKDAMSVCGSMYRLNAKSAVGYLFNPNGAGKQVSSGMFFHDSPYDRDEMDSSRWTGYINFKDKTVEDLESQEIIDLSTMRADDLFHD